ncbi:MAG: hypothetical protein ABIJ94_02725 [candidate division WOR-3 bacterium]
MSLRTEKDAIYDIASFRLPRPKKSGLAMIFSICPCAHSFSSLRTEGEAISKLHWWQDCFVAMLLAMTFLAVVIASD